MDADLFIMLPPLVAPHPRSLRLLHYRTSRIRTRPIHLLFFLRSFTFTTSTISTKHLHGQFPPPFLPFPLTTLYKNNPSFLSRVPDRLKADNFRPSLDFSGRSISPQRRFFNKSSNVPSKRNVSGIPHSRRSDPVRFLPLPLQPSLRTRG